MEKPAHQPSCDLDNTIGEENMEADPGFMSYYQVISLHKKFLTENRGET